MLKIWHYNLKNTKEAHVTEISHHETLVLSKYFREKM